MSGSNKTLIRQSQTRGSTQSVRDVLVEWEKMIGYDQSVRDELEEIDRKDKTNYIQTVRIITYQPRFKHIRPPYTRWLWLNKLFYRIVEDKKFDGCYPTFTTTMNTDPNDPPLVINFKNHIEGGNSSDVEIH